MLSSMLIVYSAGRYSNEPRQESKAKRKEKKKRKVSILDSVESQKKKKLQREPTDVNEPASTFMQMHRCEDVCSQSGG